MRGGGERLVRGVGRMAVGGWEKRWEGSGCVWMGVECRGDEECYTAGHSNGGRDRSGGQGAIVPSAHVVSAVRSLPLPSISPTPLSVSAPLVHSSPAPHHRLWWPSVRTERPARLCAFPCSCSASAQSPRRHSPLCIQRHSALGFVRTAQTRCHCISAHALPALVAAQCCQ